MSREYDLVRTSGGLALEYLDLIEADFAAANGAAYVPPERDGNFSARRINAARTMQLLYDCPVVVETFQASAATLHLPANTASDITDDAGNGRFFIIKNSGTGNITIKDYLGVTLYTVHASYATFIVGNSNNSWDFIYDANSVFFDNTVMGLLTSNDVQDAIDELTNITDVSASPGFTWGRSGNTTAGTWLLNDTVPSNRCGRENFLYNAEIQKVFVANQDATIIKLGFYWHDGDSNNITLLGTVTTAAQRSNDFDVSWSVARGKQIAVKVEDDSANSAKEPVVGLLIKGTKTA